MWVTLKRICVSPTWKKPTFLKSVSRMVCWRGLQLVHTKCKFVTLILKVNAMQPQTAHPKKLEMSLLVKTGTFCEWLPNRHSCISTWAKEQVMGGGG